MTISLTDQHKSTLRTAAYGAVSLLSAADAAGSPHKTATHGSLALTSATGPIGHILAANTKDITLDGKTVAELADQVLPALTAAVTLLKQQAPTEVDNFRRTVLLAVETATHGKSSPTLAETTRKITAALDAA